MARPTILILTTHTGGGHLNLARSLRDMLEPDYDVVIANPQPGIFGPAYTAQSRHAPKLIELQHTLTDSARAAFLYHRLLALFSSGHILALLERYRPHLVITTHALLSYATARVIERSRRHTLLVFQLTDLERLHMTWFTEKQADAYFAPTKEIFVQAQQEGIDEDRLHLTGRPVRRQFGEVSPEQTQQIRTGLGFDATTFTIFLQGGATGSSGIDGLINGLLSINMPVQVILAAGNNASMASRYAGIEQVRSLPFTERLAPYMAIADMIAGKAGASFISEAFMLEKPFLATTFISGQETPNLHFIEQHNLGWVCLKTQNQLELLSSLARHPEMLAAKLPSIRDYKAWNSEANRRFRPVIDRLLS
ncbi:MAG TPA: glycosyltransferase [Ktedonobacteraceae bacterium]|nr:glycosyltransferase [Ktedonobacteraceae bacterium]